MFLGMKANTASRFLLRKKRKESKNDELPTHPRMNEKKKRSREEQIKKIQISDDDPAAHVVFSVSLSLLFGIYVCVPAKVQGFPFPCSS